MNERDKKAWINEVMEQAQVFASAWALIGSRFAGENALEHAEQMKGELRAMLTHPPSRPAETSPFAEAVMDEMEKLNNGDPARLIQMVEDRAQSHNGPHLLTLELNQLAAWMRGKTWNGISPPNQMELKMVTCKKEPTNPRPDRVAELEQQVGRLIATLEIAEAALSKAHLDSVVITTLGKVQEVLDPIRVAALAASKGGA